MSFAGLVSGDATVSMEQYKKLQKLLEFYESENLRLRSEVESNAQVINSHVDRIQEQERARQALLRKIKSAEGSIKFEKIANDGLTKKAGILDLQLANITEERRILVEEQVFNRQRLKDLEKTSNDDRSKRLKDMHENELLKRKAMDLENRVSLAEADSRKAQAELLEKIQIIETLQARVEFQERTIATQAADVNAHTREIFEGKEREKRLLEQTLSQEMAIGQYIQDRNAMDEEIWRLRKDLTCVATTASEKSLANSQGYSRTRLQSRQTSSRHGDLRTTFSRSSTSGGAGFELGFGDSTGYAPGVLDSSDQYGGTHGGSGNGRALTTRGAPAILTSISGDGFDNISTRQLSPDNRTSQFHQQPAPKMMVSPMATAHRPSSRAATASAVSFRHPFTQNKEAEEFARDASTQKRLVKTVSLPAMNTDKHSVQSISAKSMDAGAGLSMETLHEEDGGSNFVLLPHQTGTSSLPPTSSALGQRDVRTAQSSRCSGKSKHQQQVTSKQLSGMAGRSMFVGAGLGIRQDLEPELNSGKGSAKQVLKMIMEQFEADRLAP